jgi:hypothetical protein
MQQPESNPIEGKKKKEKLVRSSCRNFVGIPRMVQM